MRQFRVIKDFAILKAILILLQVYSECDSFSWKSTLTNKGDLWSNGISWSALAGGLLLANNFIVISSGSSIPAKAQSSSITPSSLTASPEDALFTSSSSNEAITIRTANTTESTFIDDAESFPTEAIPSAYQSNKNNRYRYRLRGVKKMKSDKERVRLELLKQIKSLDHMKCFPKVLCGLSVDSSKNSGGIDSHLVRSYIQLMRSATPEDDSSEESKPSMDSTKDALSLFLMKSGILRPVKLKQNPVMDTSMSQSSTSVSEEDYLSEEEYPPLKSSLEIKNEQLKKLLSSNIAKRKLDTSDDDLMMNQEQLDRFQNHHHHHHPAFLMTEPPKTDEGDDQLSASKITSQIGSLVSSWVPWVSFSFGTDSFEKDPFFTGGGATTKTGDGTIQKDERWQKELDKLSYLMKLKKAAENRRKYKGKKVPRITNGVNNSTNSTATKRSGKDINLADDEMIVYSTAIDIGKKLKDTRQCDYLYNGCPVPYSEIIKIITSIRKEIKQEDETVEALSQEILDYIPELKVSETNKQKVPNKIKNRIKPTKTIPAAVVDVPQQQQQQHNTVKRKQMQSPITKISHTLPNGEKVEINVQLSGSGKSGVEYDEEQVSDVSVPQEEFQEEQVEEDAYLPQDDEIDPFLDDEPPQVQEQDQENSEPAISASYELDDEKIDDDFRKPSPSEIFNKISLKGTTKRPTPSTTRRPIETTSKMVVTQKPKPRPKPPTTAKPSRTTKRPTKKPSNPPRQPTVKPRRPPATSVLTKKQPSSTTARPVNKNPTSSRVPSTTGTKRPTKVTLTTKSSTQTKNPTIKVSTVTTKRPMKTTTTIKPLRAPLSKRRRPSTSTTELPPMPDSSESFESEEFESNPVTIKYPKRKPQPTSVTITTKSQTTTKKAEMTTTTKKVQTTTKKPTATRITTARPTTTTPTTTTTLPPLAMFTKTVMEQVIEEMYSIKEIHDSYQYHPSATTSIPKYSVIKKSQSKPTSDSFIVGKPTSQVPYEGSSVSSDPEAEIKFNPMKEGEGTHLFNFDTEKVTTTQEPKLFQSHLQLNKDDSLENKSTQKLGSGEGGKKKKIKYKNPKLPYLVVMNAENMELPLPSSQLGNNNHRNRPKPTQNRIPQYTLTKSSNSTKADAALSIESLLQVPQVYQPKPDSSENEQPYWVPTFT